MVDNSVDDARVGAEEGVEREVPVVHRDAVAGAQGGREFAGGLAQRNTQAATTIPSELRSPITPKNASAVKK